METYDDLVELSNVLIFQNDLDIQEIWDFARDIKCNWIETYTKKVKFNPFSVGMLSAEEVVFEGEDEIDCWMDIQLGYYPETTDIKSIVKIGDTLALLVYVRDNNKMFDINVKDCYAFGGSDDSNSPSIQLTDDDGCVMKEKLISNFVTVREYDPEGSILVSYAHVKAFKFPDVMDVHMACNMEICKGECDKVCGDVTTKRPFRSGSTLFGEPIYTKAPTPTVPICYPGSPDPNCNQEPDCSTDYSDPRCTTPTTTSTTTTEAPCYPGSTDPRCPQPELDCSRTPNHPDCEESDEVELCYPGSNDPSCTTTKSPRSGSTLFPHYQTTPKPTTKKKVIVFNTPAPEPQPEPESSGGEWAGEPKYHAFHSYHYSKGDGRRNRNNRRKFGSRLKRNIVTKINVVKKVKMEGAFMVAPLTQKHRRSRRDIHDIESINYLEMDQILNDQVCVSFQVLTFGLAVLMSLLFITTSLTVVLLIRQRKFSTK